MACQRNLGFGNSAQGTKMAQAAVEQLYDGMAKAFERSANTFQKDGKVIAR